MVEVPPAGGKRAGIRLTEIAASSSLARKLVQVICLGLGIALLLAAWLQGAIAEPELPPLDGRVVDAAHVLGSAAIARLSTDLRDYEARTGTQIVIVTLPDLQGYSIETWGLALLRGWQIGQKGKNNGVVVIVAPHDRQVRIETGYGAEGPLPDATASAIIREEMKPRFKQGDFAGGLIAAVARIEAALANDFPENEDMPASAASNAHRLSPAIVILIAAPFAFMLVVLLLYLVFRSRQTAFSSQAGSDGRRSYSRRRDDDWNDSDSGASAWGYSSYSSSSSSDSSSSSSSSDDSFSGDGGSGGGGGASDSW